MAIFPLSITVSRSTIRIRTLLGTHPDNLHVEAGIVKGRFGDYDTFLAREAVEYLREYLDMRRRDSLHGKIPPEHIDDESPLIRGASTSKVKPMCDDRLYRIVHKVYMIAGLIRKDGDRKRMLLYLTHFEYVSGSR